MHASLHVHTLQLVIFGITDNPCSDHSKSGPPEAKYKVCSVVCNHSRSEGYQGDCPGG